jgi:hypothetical protein
VERDDRARPEWAEPFEMGQIRALSGTEFDRVFGQGIRPAENVHAGLSARVSTRDHQAQSALLCRGARGRGEKPRKALRFYLNVIPTRKAT